MSRLPLCTQPRPGRTLFLASCLSLGALPLLTEDVQARTAARSQIQSFDQAAAPLGQALNRFSAATGITLSYDPDQVRGLQAPALSGQMSPEQALQQLLRDSNLRLVPLENGSYSLQPGPSTPEDHVQLDAVEIVHSELEPQSYRSGESAIADKFETPFLEQTQTVHTVNAQVLNDFAATNLEDVIKFVPGITVGNSFGGTQESLIKRGFGSVNDGATLRDGIRTSRGRTFDSATTERVDVLKGPASLLYGMQEPGGVVNVISKKPTYYWRSTLSGQLLDEGGGSGFYDISGPLGETGLAFRLIGKYKDEDYWRNFGVNRDKLIAPSLAFNRGPLSVNLSYEYSDYTSTFDRGTYFHEGRYVGDRNHRIDEHWTRMTGTRQFASLAAEYQLADASRLRLTYGWNREQYRDYQADPNGYNPETGELRRRFRSNRNDRNDRNYLSLEWLGDLQLAGMRHQMVLGADHERHDDTVGSFYQGSNEWGFNPDQPEYGNLEQVSSVQDSNSDQRSKLRMLSFYAKDNIHLNDQWILSLGWRHQKFRQRDEGGIPRQIGTNLNRTKNLPFVGLVYKLNDTMSLYANYSESYQPNRVSAGQRVEGSKPEEGRQYELGFRYDNGWLSGLVSIYDIRKENIQSNQIVDGEVVTRILGEAESKGLEASLTGEIGEHWNLIANYAYTDAEITKDSPEMEGNDLRNVARNSGSLFATYRLPSHLLPGTLRIGGGARYVGQRQGDTANSFEMSAYTTYDAFVAWDLPGLIGKAAHLKLNVDNLSNKRYFISSGDSNRRVSWGPERQVRLSGSIDF